MKKYFTILLSMIFVFSLSGCSGTEYTLSLPEKEDVKYIEFSLNGSVDKTMLEKEESIEAVLDLLNISSKATTKENSEEIFDDMGYYTIYIHTNDDVLTCYVYPKGKKRYIEQENNGTYEITNDEYGNISAFIQAQKVEVGNATKENLKEITETLKPLDEKDKDFKTSELTNEELLRYAFLIFNPKESGVKEISFKDLNGYIAKYFGTETVTPQDITCNCGQVIAKYNPDRDVFVWDDFHYTLHRANSINAVRHIYKVEDRYVVEVLKMFADTEENFNEGEYNFYTTYNDSKTQQNILDTVENPQYPAKEYIGRISPGKLMVYKLTFTSEAPYKLIKSEIVGTYTDISESVDNGRHSANPYQLLFRRLWEKMYD